MPDRPTASAPLARPASPLRRRALRAVAALALLVSLAPAAAADPFDDAAAAFAARTGARLVFDRTALPDGPYYTQLPVLSAARQLAAARILLAEAEKYPRGYRGAVGLRAIGVFAACVADESDGSYAWDDARGGYVYFGVWNGRDAIAAAYYNDTQLPLTFHHEVFHAVDAARAGVSDRDANFASDDARFLSAVSGEAAYPAARIGADDLARLAALGDGEVLADAVGRYAAKGG